jgi:hypothetical protein
MIVIGQGDAQTLLLPDTLLNRFETSIRSFPFDAARSAKSN